MIHLSSVTFTTDAQNDASEYPFNVPTIKQLEKLTFSSPVTFFVGENGTGKSTLLEAIAAAVGSITVGSTDIRRDPSLAAVRRLSHCLRLTWPHRTHGGFFLRAEDFLGFTQRMAELVQQLGDMADGYERTLSGYGLDLARGAVLEQRRALVERYGEDLSRQSHGESFLQLFRERFVPGGLYLLDEPDTALSTQRQLALLALLKDMVGEDAQFIIATQSPVLMAFRDSTILSLDRCPAVELPYDEVDQVVLARGFLKDPDSFLRHL